MVAKFITFRFNLDDIMFFSLEIRLSESHKIIFLYKGGTKYLQLDTPLQNIFLIWRKKQLFKHVCPNQLNSPQSHTTETPHLLLWGKGAEVGELGFLMGIYFACLAKNQLIAA